MVATRAWRGERIPALLALSVPVLAGLVYFAAYDAPPAYLAINAAAMALASAWILFGGAPGSLKAQRILVLALLAALFLPLLTGPDINGIARWLALGPVTLHAGMLAFPALAVFAARDPDFAAPILLAALLATCLQPDAATALAVTFAAVGLHHVTQDWKVGTALIVGFFATILTALRGELPAKPFVERVVVEAALNEPWVGLALLLALAAGLLLIVMAAPLDRPARFALGGALFGFGAMALTSNYPTPLIGHGAASILGFGLALGLREKRPGGPAPLAKG